MGFRSTLPLLLVMIFVLGSCDSGFSPTEVAPPDDPTASAFVIPPQLSTSSDFGTLHPSMRVAVCLADVRRPGRDGPMLRRRTALQFGSEAIAAAAGETTTATYRRLDSGGRLIQEIRCTIPRSFLALEAFKDRFMLVSTRNAALSDGEVIALVEPDPPGGPNNPIPLDPIIVDPCADNPFDPGCQEDEECDPWYDLNWCQCQDDPMNAVAGMGTGDAGTAGLGSDCDEGWDPDPGEGGGGGGGGNSDPPPPDCEEDCEDEILDPDPCDTGDPLFDSSGTQDAWDALWKASNFQSNKSERRETAGWLVPKSSGVFELQGLKVSDGPCFISMSILDAPTNAVAYVHVHPWSAGEVMTPCPDPEEVYTNGPSEWDLSGATNAQNLWDALHGPGVFEPRFVMIDNETVHEYNAAQAQVTDFSRCGY